MISLLCAVVLMSRPMGETRSIAPRATDQCPFCGLDVLKDSDSLNYRVTMEKGGKKIPYRCILCALGDAKADKSDLVILAPSEDKEKPIKIERKDDKWTVTPDKAVFAYAKGSHSECQIRYRALTSEDAFKDYQAKFPKLLSSAKPISLEDLIKKAE